MGCEVTTEWPIIYEEGKTWMPESAAASAVCVVIPGSISPTILRICSLSRPLSLSASKQRDILCSNLPSLSAALYSVRVIQTPSQKKKTQTLSAKQRNASIYN